MITRRPAPTSVAAASELSPEVRTSIHKKLQRAVELRHASYTARATAWSRLATRAD